MNNWFIRTINSSIGQKYLMSLTGLFLCTFLVVHLVGNLQLLIDDGGYKFNKYALFMTTNPLIKTVSYLLYATILFHAVKGIALALYNRKARPVKYAVDPGPQTASWASRSMALLGTVIFLFIVVHMYQFWFTYKFGSIPWVEYKTELTTGTHTANAIAKPEGGNMISFTEDGVETFISKDLYFITKESFKNPLIVLFYIIALAAVAFHLWHGFQSAFQSLGADHPKYFDFIKKVGQLFSVAIPAVFALIPLYMLILK